MFRNSKNIDSKKPPMKKSNNGSIFFICFQITIIGINVIELITRILYETATHIVGLMGTV